MPNQYQTISPKTQKEMRKLHTQGMSLRAIGRKLGVHNTSVMNYLNPDKKPAVQRMATASKPSREDDQKQNEWKISLAATRIHTLDQMVKFCEIDLNVWEVERFVCNKWEVGIKVGSGESSRVKTEPLYQVKVWLKKKVLLSFIREEIERLKAEARIVMPAVPAFIRARSTSTGIWVEHSLYDHHFGALIWSKETGREDYDSKIAREVWDRALGALVLRTDSYDAEGAVFILGQDLMNSNNRQGSTEAQTQQSMDSRYQKMYGVTRDAAVWAIDRLVSRYKRVHVPIVGGNHDPQASWHLGEYLELKYCNNKNVTIDNAPTFRKWWEYGVNMVMFAHGNKGKLEEYGRTMAAEKFEMWGRTQFREAHTGHIHHKRVWEFDGYIARSLSSLRPPCAWSAENLYGAIRAAESFVWSRTEGLIGTANYSISPKKER